MTPLEERCEALALHSARVEARCRALESICDRLMQENQELFESNAQLTKTLQLACELHKD